MITSSKRVMHYAHALYNHFSELKSLGVSDGLNWGESLTEAWRILRVREALSKGVLYIVYYKGLETQCRRATLCPKYIPSSDAPKGTRDAEIEQGLTQGSWGVINYYDLDKMGWRSLKIQSLRRATPTTVQLDFKTLGVGESIYG